MSALTNPDAFIQSLFAPLPDDAEPVMTIEDEREWRKEIKEAWWRARVSYEAARHLYDGCYYLRLLDSQKVRVAAFGNLGVDGATVRNLDCIRKFLEHGLILTPAPTREDLLKKKRLAKWWLEHAPDAAPRIEAAIAHDEERLARRAKPRRRKMP